jgi:ornithine cyclodeaminase
LFEGTRLAVGVHVNAIGTHRPAERELDTEAMRRGLVVVESREAALREAGELCVPISEGVFDASHIVADLSEALTREVRRSDNDITVFKSVGLAFEDLAVAAAVCKQIPA